MMMGLDSSANHAEEEEALEDQRRRNEEIGNQLLNAFDDLETEETSIDLSCTSQKNLMGNLGYRRNELQCNYKNDAVKSSEENWTSEQKNRAELFIESLKRQLETAEKIVTEERERKIELEKRLAISEAELDRTIASKNNEHQLLVESKEKCSNLENEINTLRLEVEFLTSKNTKLEDNLMVTQTMLSDLQQKYNIIEKHGIYQKEDRKEIHFKKLEGEYLAKMDIMQQKIKSFEKKVKELEEKNKRFEAIKHQNANMLEEKLETINKLSTALKKTQADNSECIRLQKFTVDLQLEIKQKNEEICYLVSQIKKATTELEKLDRIVADNCDEDISHYRDAETDKSFSMDLKEKFGMLKRRLCDAIEHLKIKIGNIRKLQETVNNLKAKIDTLHKEENNSLVQISTLQEENMILRNRQVVLEKEIEDIMEKLSFYTEGNNGPQDEMVQLCRNNNLSKEKSISDSELRNGKNLIETLKENENPNKGVEVDQEPRYLNRQSIQAHEKRKSFQPDTFLCRKSNSIRQEPFENASYPTKTTTDKSVETSFELASTYFKKKFQCQVRNKFAQIFSRELNSFKNEYRKRMSEIEEQNLSLQKIIHKISSELIKRENEVNLLKHAILSEREHVEDLLKNKDMEMQEFRLKQNVILNKCHHELKLKDEHISQLFNELDERQKQIEAERKSMKCVMEQWEKQGKTVNDVQNEWVSKLNELKKNHEIIMSSMKHKYKSMKKTAANYKRYAEDKEKFMMQEYERIKAEYELSLAKIESRVRESFQKNETKQVVDPKEKDNNFTTNTQVNC